MQIIPARKDYVGESLREFNESGAPQRFAQHFKNKEAKKKLEEENKVIKDRFGIDLSSISNPEERKIIMTEMLKRQGKEDLLNKRTKLISEALGTDQQPSFSDEIMRENPAKGIFKPEFEQQIASQTGKTQEKKRFDAATIPDEMILKIGTVDPEAAREVRAAKDSALKQQRFDEESRTKKESQYFALNEPKLEKIAETERKLDIENARYGRLEELFGDPSKFPSGLTAALFTKEGQLSDVAYSQLSPEAQEAVKLIIDSTSNIKDTYGARVTNLDLQTYLRKLPSLLNSHEGRMRVLRDLKDLNEINQLYNRGIQEVFDEAGGTDKIAFSEAEKRFKKKYGKQLEQKLKDFATPEQKVFNERPDPSRYLGKKIKDSETGEIFISDGKEWKPFGEQNGL